MKKKLLIVGVLIFLLVAGTAIYFLARTPQQTRNNTPTMLEEFSRTIPPGMKEYHHNFYHFSILYPESLSISERYEGGSATTFVFENVAEGIGFQIFVLPYGKDQVTETRLSKDSPLGVRENLTDITIDGATRASFFGRNMRLGDTREIWFIHDGYLFEVTTIKPLASWLDEIMTSWQFFDYKNQSS